MTAFRRNVEVDIPAAGTMGCYVAVPDRPNGSALVVLQEIFGVNQYIRSVVETFADAGFVAIAPDLFWRQVPGVQLNSSNAADRERATTLLKGLDPEQAVADAEAALAFAKDRTERDRSIVRSGLIAWAGKSHSFWRRKAPSTRPSPITVSASTTFLTWHRASPAGFCCTSRRMTISARPKRSRKSLLGLAGLGKRARDPDLSRRRPRVCTLRRRHLQPGCRRQGGSRNVCFSQ